MEHGIVSYNSSHVSVCSLGQTISGRENAGLPLDLEPVGFSTGLVDIPLASSWFASSETWKIGRFPQVEGVSFSVTDLKRYLTKIHWWLIQWVENGSNQFIHPWLYRTRFPRCIQDAYTALSCYLGKTASNEQMIFRIIEDRAKQLLVDHGDLTPNAWPRTISPNAATLDPLEHVARVQALLVYQILCLNDGDIRLRHLAESHIPVLNSWIHQMVEHASQTVCLGVSIVSPTYEQAANGFRLPNGAHDENLLWYSWILAESIRRTWLVASSLQTIYTMIQLGRISPCPGGMMFSTRQGVWEAQSARAWEKLCSEVNVGFIQLEDAERLFTEGASVDINDFAKVFLAATFGVDRMERWGIQIDD